MSPWHHEQTLKNSCVAACMCIVQRWRGEMPAELAHHEGASPRGQALSEVLGIARGRRVELGHTEEDELKVHLQNDGIVVAGVAGHPYVHWQQRYYEKLQSRHGALCAPGSFDGPMHAVVLVEWASGGYRLLDPWFSAEGQPLWISAEDFSACFNGIAVLVDPQP